MRFPKAQYSVTLNTENIVYKRRKHIEKLSFLRRNPVRVNWA